LAEKVNAEGRLELALIYQDDRTQAEQFAMALQESGYAFDSFNGRSVGVVGDGRVYGPVAIMKARGRISIKRAGELSTQIINETPGITRVMIDITPKRKKKKRRS
jgi:GMP synthase PP-ATPase subunit